MNRRDDGKHSADKSKYGKPASGQNEEPAKITTAEKTFRAITAVVVFAIPLVTGSATLISYAVYKVYKRITGNS
jgi:hypothetical protein